MEVGNLSLVWGFTLGEFDESDDVWEFLDGDVDVAEDGWENCLELAMPEPNPYVEPRTESIKKMRRRDIETELTTIMKMLYES